jgi:hypothetical protein
MITTSRRWNIPEELAQSVMARDKTCVYCHTTMVEYVPRDQSRCKAATWEHIDNDIGNITPDNICLCCHSCNSSKGARPLRDWFTTSYCVQRQITSASVAEVVRRHLSDDPRDPTGIATSVDNG